MSNVPSIEVEQLRDMLASPNPPIVIDVREPREYDICKIPTSQLIPLGDLPNRLAELPKDQTFVMHCHHGGRSSRATALLLTQGYAKVFNLAGGIHAWSERIDAQVKTYS